MAVRREFGQPVGAGSYLRGARRIAIRRLEVPRHVFMEKVRVPFESASNELDIRSLSGPMHGLAEHAVQTPSAGREQCEACDHERPREEAGRGAGDARVPAPFRQPPAPNASPTRGR